MKRNKTREQVLIENYNRINNVCFKQLKIHKMKNERFEFNEQDLQDLI
jgi:hypothetical protein